MLRASKPEPRFEPDASWILVSILTTSKFSVYYDAIKQHIWRIIYSDYWLGIMTGYSCFKQKL